MSHLSRVAFFIRDSKAQPFLRRVYYEHYLGMNQRCEQARNQPNQCKDTGEQLRVSSPSSICTSNVIVRQAAANDVDFTTRAARGYNAMDF